VVAQVKYTPELKDFRSSNPARAPFRRWYTRKCDVGYEYFNGVKFNFSGVFICAKYYEERSNNVEGGVTFTW